MQNYDQNPNQNSPSLTTEHSPGPGRGLVLQVVARPPLLRPLRLEVQVPVQAVRAADADQRVQLDRHLLGQREGEGEQLPGRLRRGHEHELRPAIHRVPAQGWID